MNKRIYLSPPHMGSNELNYVQEAFRDNWIAPVGPHINQFEKELASYLGSQYAAALSSGTAAIHLALIMLGIKAGDEVICSSFTFAGSCNPIVYQGATPVFVDSDKETWNMDPALLEEAIIDREKKGKKTKAIILVHLYGMPAKIDEILSVAKKYGIPIIEDAAEALGSTYKGRKLGTFGEIGIISFNGNKIITTSGGGALVSDKKEWIDKAKFLSTQARDDAPHYEHSQIGYNYRMSNISAGIGRGQLEVLDAHMARRREIFKHYHEQLGNIKGIQFLEEPAGVKSNRWLTTLLVDKQVTGVDRETIRLELEELNIESRPLWKPMHLQPVFQSAEYFGNGVCDQLFEQGICLPSGSSLTPDQQQFIINEIKAILQVT